MDKNKRMIWVLAVMWVVSLSLIIWVRPKQQPAPQQKPAVSVEQAQNQAAKGDKRSLNTALKTYQGIIKAEPHGAKELSARLQTGAIYEKLKNQQAAVQAYSEILRDYPVSKWSESKTAEDRLTAIDRKNSGTTLYKVIDTLVALTGRNPKYSYFLALLIITVVFKVITTPLSNVQFKSMKEMQKIQPLVRELQEKYKGDQQQIGAKTMELYKEHGVNPFAGCLPVIVQFPVLWLLYVMVRLYQVQFAHGEFLWIGSSLAHKFPGIVGANLALPDVALVIIYIISMIISQKIAIVDPSQAEQQKIMMWTMPIVFGYIFWKFPSAFMLYWLLFNILSTAQQYAIMKGPQTPVAAAAGGGQITPSAGTPRPKSGKRRR
jgi:YidC/Oxa1 family membrane protein insertase